jgi:2-iminobutanoate/2-iminopropanoate deaminase
VLAGDYLYVSGQGGAVNGRIPEGIDAQTRACLNNVKAIVEGAGFRMDQVVYAHLYLADIRNYQAVNRIWPEYFTQLPARATLAVTRMPTDTPIEITVTAYRGRREALTLADTPSPVPISPGVTTADRFYIAGILGRDSNAGTIPNSPEAQAEMVFSRLARVLKAAGVSARSVAFTNLSRTPAMPLSVAESAWKKFFGRNLPAAAIVEVPALPFGANISITGVAARYGKTLRRDGGCVAIGSTRFCGLVTDPDLAKLDLNQVVAANVYIDSIDRFGEMNAGYAQAFAGKDLPSRTTVQPLAPERSAKLRLSWVSVR